MADRPSDGPAPDRSDTEVRRSTTPSVRHGSPPHGLANRAFLSYRQHVNTIEHGPTVSRRTLTTVAAWAVPTAVVSVAAPASATSLRKVPGING